jgi:D-sedoheptulose 7-phosphate isomerase
MAEGSAEDMVRSRLAENAALAEALREGACAAEIAAVAELTATALRGGGKLLLFGNGGSAAEAVHVAAEFIGRYVLERRALPAIALTENLSSVTAIGNDYGYDAVFARQVRALGAPGDVAVGMSTSGRSANVVEGLRAARELGLATVGMTGEEAGPVGETSDRRICIPSAETARIQEGHLLASHLVCEWAEARLAEDPAPG